MTESIDENPSADSVGIARVATSAPMAAAAFALNLARIREILKASEPALVNAMSTFGSLHDKVMNAPSQEHDESEQWPGVIRQENGMLKISISEEDFIIIREAVSDYRKVVDSLPQYLNNMLCMAAWSAFEGYLQSFLAELFIRRPALLSSDKKISYADVLNSMNNIVELLVAKEIDEIGHLGFEKLQIYLKSKVMVQFSGRRSGKMAEIYLLRNILAHAAGKVRPDQLPIVPQNVLVKNEIQISKEYLKDALDCLSEAVLQFNNAVAKKYDI